MFVSKPKTAAEWMVRLSAGELSSRDQRDLEQWLAQKPEHKKQLEQARQLWSLSQQLRNSATARSLLAEDDIPAQPRRRVANFLMAPYLVPALGAAALLVVAFLALPTIQKFTASSSQLANNSGAATALGQIANYTLPDGSTLTLGAASTARIAFTDKQRVVYLTGGEGFFDVIHNVSRPFIVVAGKKRVVVAGTKFNVDYLPKESDIQVAVVEGLVNVSFPAPNAADKVMPIKQNEVVQFTADGSAVPRSVSAAHASAWRTGELYFDDATLREVLASVNRYSRKPVMTGNPEMEKLTLTGMFQAGDLNAVLVSLNDLHGLKAQELSDRWLLVQNSN